MNIPNELQVKLLLDLGYPDLLNLCQTNKFYNYLCHSDYLWQRLLQKDFPTTYDYKNRDYSYKQYYMYIYNYIYQATKTVMNDFNINISHEQILDIIDIFKFYSFQNIQVDDILPIFSEIEQVMGQHNTPSWEIGNKYIRDILSLLHVNTSFSSSKIYRCPRTGCHSYNAFTTLKNLKPFSICYNCNK